MYREAMEHLMAAPASKTSSTICRPKEETNPRATSTASCGEECEPADAGQNGEEATIDTSTVRKDEAMDDECVIPEWVVIWWGQRGGTVLSTGRGGDVACRNKLSSHE